MSKNKKTEKDEKQAKADQTDYETKQEAADDLKSEYTDAKKDAKDAKKKAAKSNDKYGVWKKAGALGGTFLAGIGVMLGISALSGGAAGQTDAGME